MILILDPIAAMGSLRLSTPTKGKALDQLEGVFRKPRTLGQAVTITTSLIPLNLLHRCFVLSRPGHKEKRLKNLSKVREGGKALPRATTKSLLKNAPRTPPPPFTPAPTPPLPRLQLTSDTGFDGGSAFLRAPPCPPADRKG